MMSYDIRITFALQSGEEQERGTDIHVTMAATLKGPQNPQFTCKTCCIWNYLSKFRYFYRSWQTEKFSEPELERLLRHFRKITWIFFKTFQDLLILKSWCEGRSVWDTMITSRLAQVHDHGIVLDIDPSYGRHEVFVGFHISFLRRNGCNRQT